MSKKKQETTQNRVKVLDIRSIRANPKYSLSWVLDGLYLDNGKLNGYYNMSFQRQYIQELTRGRRINLAALS